MFDDLRYLIALMSMKGIGSTITRHLISEFGSAQSVFESDATLLTNMGNIGRNILEQRNNVSLLRKADEEIDFIQNHHIKTLAYGKEGYPTRLLDCPDAPALLFYLGNANLNNPHVISVVGTRNATQYGKDCVKELVKGIKETIPDALIVSGLALGIDVSSHKEALDNSLPTVGVLAHGLDRIYPSNHIHIAKQMIKEGGGLLSEYTIGKDPERCNYLIFNNFSFLSTSFFCKIPSLFIIKIIGQFGHIKKSIVNFCKNFQFFSLFSKNVPIWCPFTLPISL